MPRVHSQLFGGARIGNWSGRLALLLAVLWLPTLATAQSLCESCEVQLGLGSTYHFWGSTGGVVVPLTLQWSEGRYELGVFRVTTQQVLYDNTYRGGRLMANPYWAVSVSRRWQLIETGPAGVFFGFGIMAKTESDQLSSTRLDFASQLGVRFRLPGNHAVAELTMRHWSNAGIRLPNHGQDFATLTVRMNTTNFGSGSGDWLAASTLSGMSQAHDYAADGPEALP